MVTKVNLTPVEHLNSADFSHRKTAAMDFSILREEIRHVPPPNNDPKPSNILCEYNKHTASLRKIVDHWLMCKGTTPCCLHPQPHNYLAGRSPLNNEKKDIVVRILRPLYHLQTVFPHSCMRPSRDTKSAVRSGGRERRLLSVCPSQQTQIRPSQAGSADEL